MPAALLFLPWRVVKAAGALLRRKGGSGSDDGADIRSASSTELGEIGESGRGATHATSQGDRLDVCAVPKLFGSTSQPPTVLSMDALLQLRNLLPLRYRPCDWALLYSTEQHGCSLRTLNTRLDGRGGVLLVVLDSLGHIFGSFVADDWRPERNYFGNGETVMFKVHPSFHRYGWTRANTHFVHTSPECVAFGGGGHFALYLDSSLEYGSSRPSSTFGNDTLAGSPDFKCIKLEVCICTYPSTRILSCPMAAATSPAPCSNGTRLYLPAGLGLCVRDRSSTSPAYPRLTLAMCTQSRGAGRPSTWPGLCSAVM